MKEVIDNLDFIKSKRFWSETNNGKRVKKQAKEWGKYFQKTQLIKDCYSEYTLLSHFSTVRLCATPETAAHQAPLSLGFSRQEHWSGLPFPSPMHEREK